MNMVKLLLLLYLISGMSFFSDKSLADQNDPRLATLFLKLGNAETPQESKRGKRKKKTKHKMSKKKKLKEEE